MMYLMTVANVAF